MRSLNHIGFFVAALVALPLTAGTPAELIHTPGFTINVLTLNQETGIGYQPAANVSFTCYIYDWQKKVSWGDGTPIDFLTHTVQSLPNGSVPPNTYPVFSNHSYAKAGTYTALAELWTGCAGVHGTILMDQETFTINVYDRLPAKSFTAPATVARGQTLTLAVTLFADAPPSGTQFFLTNNKPAVFSAFSGSLTVPPKADQAQVTVTIAKTAPLGVVKVTAIGGDGPHVVNVNVT